MSTCTFDDCQMLLESWLLSSNHMYIMPFTDTIVVSPFDLYCHTDTAAVVTAPVVVSMFVHVFIENNTKKP